MNPKLVAVAVALLAATSARAAQDEVQWNVYNEPNRPERHGFAIHTDPFPLLVGGGDLGFQVGVLDHITLGANFGYFPTGWADELRASSTQYDVQVQVWPFQERLASGAFVRGYVGRADTTIASIKDATTGEVYSATKVPSTDVATLVGYHARLVAGLHVEGAIGAGYLVHDSYTLPVPEGYERGSKLTMNGLGLRLSLRAGWSF